MELIPPEGAPGRPKTPPGGLKGETLGRAQGISLLAEALPSDPPGLCVHHS